MFWFSTKPISNQTWLLPAHVNPGNFCFWNPQSWALESGIQLKESGIQNPQRTIKNPRIQDFLGAVADPGEGPRLPPPPPPPPPLLLDKLRPEEPNKFWGEIASPPPPLPGAASRYKTLLNNTATPSSLGTQGSICARLGETLTLPWTVSRNRERVAQPFSDLARATRLEIKPRNTFLYALRISLFVL